MPREIQKRSAGTAKAVHEQRRMARPAGEAFSSMFSAVESGSYPSGAPDDGIGLEVVMS